MKLNKKLFGRSLYKISTILFLVGYNFAPSFLAIDQLKGMVGEITPVAAADGPYTISSTSGIWTKVEGTSNYSGVNTSEIRWGTGNPRSGLKFNKAGTQTFDADQKFLIGDLTHMNWPVSGGTADSATLKVTLNFSQPPLSPNPTFSYKFNIKETSNNYYNYWNCPGHAIGEQLSKTPCDDVITFPSAYGQEVFPIGDMKYTLKIDGFQSQYPTGNPVSKFITEERKDNVAYLVGHLSSILMERPAISIVKKVNGQDANTLGEAVQVNAGETVNFTYIVQNTGNVKLTNIAVTDDKGVNVSCPKTELDAGTNMTCTGSATAIAGNYTNIGTVTSSHDLTASDSANYVGIVPTIRICHASGSHTNPYIVNNPSASGDLNGHAGHTGPIWTPGITVEWGDIIPPFTYYNGVEFPGVNWSAYGEAVYNNNCVIPHGQIIVKKVLSPASNSNQAFEIVGSGTPAIEGTPTFLYESNSNIGSISRNQSHTYNVMPGTYNIEETVPAGWSLVSNACSNITITNNETKECIITNTQDGSLTIVKKALPFGTDTFGFTLTGGNEVNEQFNLVDNSATEDASKTFSLKAGTYAVAENDYSSDWNTTHSCTDGKTIDNIVLNAGENVTCTFTNTKYGSISGYKYEDADNSDETTTDRTPVSGWTIILKNKDGDEIDRTTTNASGYYEFTELLPADYIVTEGLEVGWIVLVGASKDVTLDAGENEEVNFVNVKLGSIKVLKNVDTDGDGTADETNVSDWKWKIDNDEYGTGIDPVGIMPGTYTISEVQEPNYHVTSMICTNKGTEIVNEVSESKSITLKSGDKVVCTFTNARNLGKLIVKKVVVNNNGGTLQPKDFSFKIDGGTPIQFEEDGQNEFTKYAGLSYSITEVEANKRGYTTTYENCTDVTVPYNDTATCTITNTDVAPQLTVIKHVINEGNDGTKSAGDFEITVTGANVSTPSFKGSEDGVTVTLDQGSFSVTEVEDAENYTATYEGCSGTINIGEKKTCTITNTGKDHKPSIEVLKTAGVSEIPETGGDVTFTYKVTNTGLEEVEITSLEDDKFGPLDGDDDCKVGTDLGAGESCEFKATFTIPANTPGDPNAPTVHKNIFTATAEDNEGNETKDDEEEEVELTPVPSLKLVKEVVHQYNSDETITAANWTLYANGDGGFSYAGDKDEYRFVKAGVEYALSESAYSGQFEASTWTCTGGELTGSVLKLQAEDDVVCTITNTALPATIKIYKDVVDGSEDIYSNDIFKVKIVDGGEEKEISDTEENPLVAVFEGLDAGTYKPEEVDIPDGYTSLGCKADKTTVGNGETLEFTCTNEVIDPILEIKKSNNAAVTGQKAGDIVEYTITVTAPKDEAEGTYVLNDVVVSDIAPAGFKYIPGTWTAKKNGVDMVITEPTYNGTERAQWILGEMVEEDEIVLTYKTKISLLTDPGVTDPGVYPDIAWVKGVSLSGTNVLGNVSTGADTPFVGTDVKVIEADTVEEGEVLGASITLPNTGASTYLTLGALIMMILGAISLLFKPFKKFKYALLASVVVFGMFLTVLPTKVSAVYEVLIAKIEKPVSPTTKKAFNIDFTAQDVYGVEIKVECYKNDVKFATFDKVNAGACPVTVDASGTYTFYVKAISTSGEVKSEDVTVEVIDKPLPVIDYSKAGNVLKFKTANDAKIVKVEIHRSDKPSYTANDTTKIHTMNVAPNTAYSWTDASAESGKTYYYALRSLDAFGNVSTMVSDPEVKVTQEATTTTPSATGTAVAGAETKTEGEVKGDTDEEIMEIKEVKEGKEKVQDGNEGEEKKEELTPSYKKYWYIWVPAILLVLGVVYIYVKRSKEE